MAVVPQRASRFRLPSFRARMRLFFFLVVLLPTIAVALVMFHLIASSQQGQLDARLGARQGAVVRLADEEPRRAAELAAGVVRDPAVAAALRSGDQAVLRRALEPVLARGARRIRVSDQGRVLADAGDQSAVLPARVEATDQGRALALVEVSTALAREFAVSARRVTGEEVVVRRGDRTLAATAPRVAAIDFANVPATVRVDGRNYRTSTFPARDFAGRQLRITTLEPVSGTEEAIARGRWLATLIILGFVLLALVAGSILSRSLQRQIDRFLAAARTIGSGDLSATVPVRGNDEFAQLGHEFNAMSAQLQERVDELRRERVRLARSLRRLGEAFASNLDRTALLQILVETAIDTLGADGGRARIEERAGSGYAVVASVGRLGGCEEAVREAEEIVLERNTLVAIEQDDGNAVGFPLRAGAGEADPLRVSGLISVWRAGSPFNPSERELFEYLASQAAVSVENVGQHELAVREAVTDALTGLPNRRHFDERLEHEVERARSLGTELALVMLDIDDFKHVNDTYGHQTGDEVLRGVADVLRSTSRDLDTPGRIGGEEMAVVLPGAGLEGAEDFAERVRTRIAELVFRPDDPATGGQFSITASLGVSAGRGAAADGPDLVAAADAALYQAKRAGKNRTVVAR